MVDCNRDVHNVLLDVVHTRLVVPAGSMRHLRLFALLLCALMLHCSSSGSGLNGTHTSSASPTIAARYDAGNATAANDEDDKYGRSDDDALTKSPLYKAQNLGRQILATIGVIPSFVAGTVLSASLLDMHSLKIATQFDSMVLALTLWQLLFDTCLVLGGNKTTVWNQKILHAFCRPGCMKRIIKYKYGDDTPLSDDDSDDVFGNYNSLGMMAEFVSTFFYYLSYQAAGYSTNVIAFVVAAIVWTSRPILRSGRLRWIYLGIFLASLLVPLIEICWWFSAIPGMAPFYVGTGAHEVDEASQRFDVDLIKSIQILMLLSIIFNAVCCALVAYKLYSYSTLDGARKAVRIGAMIEISKRLAFYPLVQLCTRLPMTAFYFLTNQGNRTGQFGTTSTVKNGHGKYVGNGWVHF